MMVVQMEMVNGERYYEVVDKAHKRVYHVDLNDSGIHAIVITPSGRRCHAFM